MKRLAMTVMLKDDPEAVKAYEEHHAHPWPETDAALMSVGIRRMFIFRFGRQLFLFMETEDDFDVERDLPKYVEHHPKAREWDEMMRTFQETVPGAPEGSTWVMMKEVYALEHE